MISNNLFLISPDNWITDERTGKQYLVLDTDDLIHDDLQQVCHNYGGYLPEPRDEHDTTFLDNLGTGAFPLGMSDTVTEGLWVWDSDGSPVTWNRWVMVEPNGGRKENCLLVLRQILSGHSGHRTDGWADMPCESSDGIRGFDTSLICERKSGLST